MVPRVGLEPTQCHHHRILSPARLPIPPSRQQLPKYNKVFFWINLYHKSEILWACNQNLNHLLFSIKSLNEPFMV